MSINLRRQISARKVPEKQFQGTLDVSVEDNLGKLGFLSEQKKKSKKSSRSRTAGPSDNGKAYIHPRMFHMALWS